MQIPDIVVREKLVYFRLEYVDPCDCTRRAADALALDGISSQCVTVNASTMSSTQPEDSALEMPASLPKGRRFKLSRYCFKGIVSSRSHSI
jgi:hypothetical protein